MSCGGPARLFVVNSRALHRFALLAAVATFLLLGAGGLVTSHGVGMAVPDWPNTFGYNMFFFPISQWVGGVFYEHTHRLLASAVGMLTTILALWLHGTNARLFLRWTGVVLMLLAAAIRIALPAHGADALVLGLSGVAAFSVSFVWPRCQPAAPWLRRLGLAAFFAVVLQGVLGGLRVVLFKDQIGIFHATLAQLFFVLLCGLALFTSRWWQEKFMGGSDPALESLAALGRGMSGQQSPAATSGLRWLFVVATGLILFQLVLGATMRHQHAGLAIPDFPLAYGKLWPATDVQSVAEYNRHRLEIVALNPITAVQIVLQMVHRFVALCILGAVGICAWKARQQLGSRHIAAKLALAWSGVILLQALLGAATIWSDKAADVATAHVLVGALSLAAGALTSILLFAERARLPRPALDPQAALGIGEFNPHPASAVSFK
jgi:heme a synthase